MKFLKFFLIVIFLFYFEISFAKTQKPKIFFSFPENVDTNEEIEVFASVSNLKAVSYDLKISIEKDGKVLSEVYNEKEKKWQNSLYYMKNFFSGPFFQGNFKLRIKKDFLFFDGDAEIIFKIRESGKSSFVQQRGKIKILKPEVKKWEIEFKKEMEAKISQDSLIIKNKKDSPKLIAVLNSLFCGISILILRLKLKQFKV